MVGRDGGKRLIAPHLLQTTRFSVVCFKGAIHDATRGNLSECPCLHQAMAASVLISIKPSWGIVFIVLYLTKDS